MGSLMTEKFTGTALASSVRFTRYMMVVTLRDGRELRVPLEWFPRLRDASAEELKDWRLIGDGIGIHWEALDEDISVEGLLGYKSTI